MKITAIQMCSSSHVDENLNQAAHFIQKAAQENSTMVVLPENFALMGVSAEEVLAQQENLGQGKIQKFLASQARANKIWIVAGTLPINIQDKVYATTLVYNDQGELAAHYEKIHLFDVTLSETEYYRESEKYAPGQKIVVIDTPLGKMGLAICYDVRFADLFFQLSALGAEFIVLPSAFTVKTGVAHWEILIRARAIENFCYMVAAAQGGKHSDNRETYGHSMVVEPWGAILAEQIKNEPGMIHADIDLKKLHEIRKKIPVMDYRNIKR